MPPQGRRAGANTVSALRAKPAAREAERSICPTCAAKNALVGAQAKSVQTTRAQPLIFREANNNSALTEAPGLVSAVNDLPAGCKPQYAGTGPNNCGVYLQNAYWLPWAYVRNATCACQQTPNSKTANCVREFLQHRLRATPAWLKILAGSFKAKEIIDPIGYQAFVQTVLTPRIYFDHVDAYKACCCPSGPAPYPAWMGVTSIPMPTCNLVGRSIREFGSCHGTPGAW
ncbi:MAG: hypothetical protein QNJ09_12070 [Paracoccaceae bacterium]|nr:hypothetical protein [Paracoccaceae bacterium]